MWRLWHKLFGWDYVQYRIAGLHYILRVKTAPSGLVYLSKYKEVIPLEDISLHQVTYLTCSRRKYLRQPTSDVNSVDRNGE